MIQKFVKISDIEHWQSHRDGYDAISTLNPEHCLAHLIKALGPLAGQIEQEAHNERAKEVEEKRIADLVIYSVWLPRALGYDVQKLVAKRINEFQDGFKVEFKVK